MQLTCRILVDFYGPVIHLTKSLHFNVIPMAVLYPFPSDIWVEIFRHILRKEVPVFHLQNELKLLLDFTFLWDFVRSF